MGEALDTSIGWVEGTADPFEPIGMVFVVRIGNRVEERSVAPRAADIFGWASPLGREETEIDRLGVSVDEGFKPDRVPPVVPEVVDVFEGLVAGSEPKGPPPLLYWPGVGSIARSDVRAVSPRRG